MINTGLLSVTFRRLPAAEVARLARVARLDGIEWGGDIHVPPGDPSAARAARAATLDAGLQVLAYGSYFRFRQQDQFEPVLESAMALGAPLIRVWAGDRPSAQVGPDQREAIAAEARRIAGLAAAAGITVAFEYHANTLTDNAASALALVRAAPATRMLWQPPNEMPEAERLAGLHSALPWVTNVHAFHWRGPDNERLPLADGHAQWVERLRVLAAKGHPFAVLLEFVKGDEPAQFLSDAQALHAIVAAVSSEPE